jgi:hypothetical protein
MKFFRFFWLAAALSTTAFAATIIMDFEAVGPQYTDVGSFYNYLPGDPVFTGATILQSPNYNYQGYPPESGINVANSFYTGEIDVNWTTGISDVSFYIDNPFDGGTAVTYNSVGGVLGSIGLPITSYGSGAVVSVPGSGVAELAISGAAHFYVIDDVSYSATPEPGTLAMFGAGALFLVGAVRRKLMP